ncbi:hypothetical protein Btru_050063 [Bulinus truncatus]|nr:hypothetical protein Btru_050063 [Bulinus truncatus]
MVYVCIVSQKKKPTQSSSSGDTEGTKVKAIVIPVLLITVIAGVVVGFAIWRRKFKRRRSDDNLLEQTNVGTDNGEVTPEMQSTYTLELGEFSIINPPESQARRCNRKSENIPHTAVSFEELGTQISAYDRSILTKQFKLISEVRHAASEVGFSVSNKNKNRYFNICAYDHSRVRLQCKNSKDKNDYINASYIRGYSGEVEFIASQGPMATTVDDFLQMLWEQKVEVVVMLTKLVEDGKFRCEKYWPDTNDAWFGSINVLLLSTHHFSDYLIRRLKLQKENKYSHDIVQFHFTSWPDNGVPESPWALVDFLLRVSSLTTINPPVVHCSAGVGRTGTYIALHNIVNEALETGRVDFFNTVTRLREDRMYMVQTTDQYAFLHKAVYVRILCQRASLTAFNIKERFISSPDRSSKGHTEIEKEFELVCQICERLKWEAEEEKYDTHSYNTQEMREKKKYKQQQRATFSPVSPRYVPFLRSESNDENNYTNAVLIPGLHLKDQHILAELPMPKSIKHFWRLVVQYKVALIIAFELDDMVTDSTIGCYLPINTNHPFYCSSFKIHSEFICYSKLWEEHKMEVYADYSRSTDHHTVIHLKVKKIDLSPENLVVILKQARTLKLDDSDRILYMCRNGSTYSGLACILNILLDRLINGLMLTVPLVVGTVKSIRSQVVGTLEEYMILYTALEMLCKVSQDCHGSLLQVLQTDKLMRRNVHVCDTEF